MRLWLLCGGNVYPHEIMPRIAPDTLFKACYGKYALAAVNVFSMEQVLALFEAGARSQAPFIVQMTPYAREYATAEMLDHMIRAAAALYPEAVYMTHLDHGNEAHCRDAIASGVYSSVMIDASHSPFKENVQRTRAIVEAAQHKKVFVEAELGVLSGVEDDISIDEKKAKYTDPDECEAFVKETGCNSLAIAVGTSHGAYKFSGGQGLQFDILEDIQRRLPGFPLVLHGGSKVNTTEVERINAAGGAMQSNAKGVEPEELQRAIGYGICKVNIATDMRLLWARIHREYFRDFPDQIDLVVPGKAYIKEFVQLMEKRFELLGATGQTKLLNKRSMYV